MKSRFFFHEQRPLHVLGKTKGEYWHDSLRNCWQISCEAINKLQQDTNLITHAFVLMKNHYHWLCTVDLPKFPRVFESFHETLNLEFKPHVIKINNFPYYKSVYRYVYSNPINAGIVRSSMDYPYSTLSYALGKRGCCFQIMDNMNLITDPIRTVHWIDTGHEEIFHEQKSGVSLSC